MQRTAILVFVVLTGCWPNAPAATQTLPAATLAPSPAPPEESYREVTIGFDVAAIGLVATSTLVYSQRGGNDPLAVGLLVAGGAAMFAAPIVHATHGHGARAVASYMLRSMFVTTGIAIGMGVGCAHEPGLLCGLGPEAGWGLVGGLAVAGTLDALLLHDRSSTWTPMLIPSETGARVGLARSW